MAVVVKNENPRRSPKYIVNLSDFMFAPILRIKWLILFKNQVYSIKNNPS
jgi:hypothetical protein